MNFLTVLEFLEKRKFESKWQETTEIDGNVEHLNITTEKENVARIDISCNDA